MPAICRKGDSLSTGHICTSTTTLDTPGQSTVRANGILIARVGDPTVPHPNPPSPPCPNHVANVNVGSSTDSFPVGFTLEAPLSIQMYTLYSLLTT